MVLQTHLVPIMKSYGLLITLLAFIVLTTALPTGLSFSEDLKTAIARKRTQERDLATSNSLSEEKRAYRLETVGVVAFKYERVLDPTALDSHSAPSEQTAERPISGGNRFSSDHKPSGIVED